MSVVVGAVIGAVLYHIFARKIKNWWYRRFKIGY